MLKGLLKWGAFLCCLFAVGVVAVVYYAMAEVDQVLAASLDFPVIDIEESVKHADLTVGERIVRIRNGCVDCHGADLAGKVVVDDPLIGFVSAPNLTPAALSEWSDSELAAAIRYGINREGKALVLMPSHEYQNLSFNDTAAIIAYLRTVPAVAKDRGDVRIGPLGYVLAAFGKMPTLIPANGLVRPDLSFQDKPREEVSWEFGRYLVQSACTGCHGPNLAGGPIPGGPPEWAPASDLRPAALSDWSLDAFVKTMRTGKNPSGANLRVPFPKELTRQMSDTELGAMWEYLRDSGRAY